jgi:hypothetical protein
MPIPNPRSEEQEQEYISRCISELYDEYGQEQAAAICYSTWRENMSVEDETPEDSQQGGVVPGVFGRTKFEFIPKAKESMNDFMSRCMSDEIVRERKKDRANRVSFCYSQYQMKYIASLAKKWR